MAKPTKLGNKWRIRWIDGEGNRRSEVFIKHGDAVKALAARSVEAERVKREGPAPRQDATVNEAADKWVEIRVPMKRSGSTDLSLLKNHVRPFFGEMRVREVSPTTIEAFKTSRRHLSERTRNAALTLLRSLIGLAVDLGWAEKIPKVQKYRERLDQFKFFRTGDEVRRFLASAHEERQAVFILYLFALQTGCRAGECAGLRWSDIDFERRLIHVQKSYDGPPKSGQSRFVPILDGLIRELKMWKLESPRNELGLVFANEDGKMLRRESRVFREVLARVLERAGFPKGYLSFHGLRHSFASHWAMNGGEMFRLKEIMGHATMEMTMRYSHLCPSIFTDDHKRLAGLTIAPATVARINDLASGKVPGVWPGKAVGHESE